MLTAEIKVNGRLVSVVTILNVGGANGPKLEGVADYAIGLEERVNGARFIDGVHHVRNWDRSRPAHELVHAAIEAIMEASK